jgi:hypothetical protein
MTGTSRLVLGRASCLDVNVETRGRLRILEGVMSAQCKRLEDCMLLETRLPCSDVMKLVPGSCKHMHLMDDG